ncbi:MAG: RecBCD enzyme subunit RecD [Chlamydiales bacterium]|nr:RecBCD enzyme subunit RecD [Chlamydiales bacterium]MCH9619535.1 RecBCD enzyme subunit RecD [Chlamydiales bacterium]MCH9623141.1 RecBCD enzyme subunit RecD [Chlamydiales bacterium]
MAFSLSNQIEPVDRYFGEYFSPRHALFLGYLLNITRAGHLCAYIKEDQLFPSWGELDVELIEQAKTLPELPIVVRRGNRWYLKRSFDAEELFHTHVKRLFGKKVEPIPFEKQEELNEEQQAAVSHALSHALTLVCGGPGTGKTFTAASLIQHFPGSVVVAAPTGKAAANLRAALPNCNVKTVHALLREKIEAELVVIDEGSMIDAERMAKLFAAIPHRLVLFGDPNQLPPVEAGSLFADLAEKGCIELTQCLRAELQEIIDLAEAVKCGKEIPYQPLPPFDEVIEMVRKRESAVLTPLRKGLYGSDSLNQSAYRGEARVPIMVMCNDRQIDLYNGDVGYLEGESAHFGKRKVARHLLPPFTYAYALSVHKSQGSEYDNVVLLLPQGSERFGREMLYTAVTRAKKHVTIFAAEGVVEKILSTQTKRLSHWSMPSAFKCDPRET